MTALATQLLTTVSFQYVKTVGNYVVGVEKEGRERWFTISKITSYEINGETLTVTLPKKDWDRRLKSDITNDEVKKPIVRVKAEAAAAHTGETRKCLLCRHPFPKEKNIYICEPCKTTSNWQSGSYMA